ncbi:Signal transduction histidine kinase [hydrothermal vent metagenome]|uniref:Signal transduction histidine kinase n=1 Tax=hydrothermal vent metagenome TaxID=652676 RepID=A0A3B0RMN0_9ZZZZ
MTSGTLLTELPATDLAALLCARICHDLVSPVSALGTALDVLDDEDASDMHDEAMDLIRASSIQAAAKLEFSRLAFGAGTSAPGQVATRELKRLIDGMFSNAKADIIWRVSAPSLSKPAARVLLNLVMLGVAAAPRGGEVSVEAASAARIRVHVHGDRARLFPIIADALEGIEPKDGFDGRSIQPYYAGLIARSLGGRAEARANGENIEFICLTSVEQISEPHATAV